MNSQNEFASFDLEDAIQLFLEEMKSSLDVEHVKHFLKPSLPFLTSQNEAL